MTGKRFNAKEALDGALVGLVPSDATQLAKYAGMMRRNATGTYILMIDGHRITVGMTGQVETCSPASELFPVGTQLFIVEDEMPAASAYGSSQSMTRSPGSGYDNEANVSNMEPRDYFAVHAMSVMLSRLEHPDAMGDAAILRLSRAAYRIAQGMVIAAADSRLGTRQSASGVDVSDGTNTEKLLDSLVESVSDLATAIRGTLKVETPSGSSLKVETPSGSSLAVQGVEDDPEYGNYSVPIRIHGREDAGGFTADPVKVKEITA